MMSVTVLAVLSHLAFWQVAVADLHVAVNPANQQAVRSLETNARREFSRSFSIRNGVHNCQRCALDGTLGAVVNETSGYVGTTTVTCAAQVGYSITCSATTTVLFVNGRWYVGNYTRASGSQRDFGPPHAAGSFRLTISNYNPTWQGNFTRSEGNRISGRTGGPGFVSRSISMPCRRTDPMPEGGEVRFSLTRTAGTETPEIRALIQGLAHEAIADHYCDRIRGAQSGSYFMNLGDALKQRMTWQAVAPGTWYA